MDAWLQLLLDCHTFAIEHHHLDTTRYMEAYGTVSSVAFQQAEIARLAVLRGFYGSAFASTRTLAVQNDLLLDFILHPESVNKWLELRGYSPDDDSAEATRLRRHFRDRSLQARIRKNGQSPLSETLYGFTSEAIHGSPWAMRLYSNEAIDRPGVVSVEYRPHYHPFRALVEANLLIATLPHLWWVLLGSEGAMGKPYSAFKALEARYFEMLDEYETVKPIVGRLIETMQAALDRVRDGDDFDTVMAQLQSLANKGR